MSIPNKYKAIPLKDAIKILLNKKNEEYSEIEKGINVMLSKDVNLQQNGEEPKISLIPNDEYSKHYVLKTMENAHEELIWYTQVDKIPIRVTESPFNEANKILKERDCKRRILAELNCPTEAIMKFIEAFKIENSNFNIRYVKPNLNVSFAIVDNRLLNFFIDEPMFKDPGKILTTNNVQILKIIKDYFELKWNSAMKKFP